MTRGQKILIAVIVILLLLLAGLLLFLQMRPVTVTPAPNLNVAVNAPVGLPAGNLNAPGFNANISSNTNVVIPAPTPTDAAGNLRRIAAAFAERYGSFSNRSNYENLEDLKALMTAGLGASTQAYVDEQRKQPPAAEFAGTTTRSISVKVEKLDEAAGSATMLINTQRREQGSTLSSEKVYYQDLRITYVKTGDAWLVDSAVWQPKP